MPTNQAIELAGAQGASHVFSTVSDERGEVQTIALKPSYISMGLPPSAFKPEFRGKPGAKVFDAAVGGGAARPGVVWFFMGNQCVEYTLPVGGKGDELSERILIVDQWGENFYREKVEAAVSFTNEPRFLWFFKNDKYIRYNIAEDFQQDPSQPILGNWPGWPVEFADMNTAPCVDAAVEGRGKYEGMAWFFKGPNYIRYNFITMNGVDIGPRPVASVWKGWPASFDRVDCALYGTGAESEVLFFFKGDEFIAYDLETEAVIGPPQPIFTKFPKLGALLLRPQLFLREQLQLTSYYGDISAGAIKSESHGIEAGAEETYTVIVKRKETHEISETMTVLESEDESIVDNVNTTMRDDENQGSSNEKYDYKFDSSFQGEMDITGFGGDMNAQLSFAGGSNTARQNASKASMNAVQKQVSRTKENRRQTSRVVAGTETKLTEFESAFTRKVVNNTGKAVNVGAFQLIQSYLTFVVLADVMIAFSNQGEPDFRPISQIDEMVEKYLVDPSLAARIKDAVIAELKQVLDYRRKPVSVIKNLGDGRIEFDIEIRSKYLVKNASGEVRREIEVPGVILAQSEFKLLTDAVLLTELKLG